MKPLRTDEGRLASGLSRRWRHQELTTSDAETTQERTRQFRDVLYAPFCLLLRGSERLMHDLVTELHEVRNANQPADCFLKIGICETGYVGVTG